VARAVPSPKGGTVYDQWLAVQQGEPGRKAAGAVNPFNAASNAPETNDAVKVGDLGSGSDYTPFLQHLGVPATDIGSDGPYGVYHSVFDNYNWFVKYADPTFVYEQQQARVFGLEVLHMADADVLPYDYRLYGREVVGYLDAAKRRATAAKMGVDFTAAETAGRRFAAAGEGVYRVQGTVLQGAGAAAGRARWNSGLNNALRDAETALLNDAGLPHRSWYKHTIYDPGEYTGYAAVVIPGVNEGIDAADPARTQSQLEALTTALNRAAAILESAAR
jgi:N-acetylated-alpha-linked acidic dipeptidase